MTGRLAHMDAEGLSKLIDYIVKHDTGNKTVGDVKKELGLSSEEYDELYILAMPAIRGYNEGRFWRVAYRQLEVGIKSALGGKRPIDTKLNLVKDILKRKSIRMLQEERLKGCEVA